jgi:hypothetical protein
MEASRAHTRQPIVPGLFAHLSGHRLYYTDMSTLASRELAVKRDVVLSFQTNHAAMSFGCLLDERSISSRGSTQAVRQSSLAVVRQHDSTVLIRDSRPRHTALQGPHGSGRIGNPNPRPRSALSALESALRIGYWKVRDIDRYNAVPTHRGTHGLATIIGPWLSRWRVPRVSSRSDGLSDRHR